MRNKTFNWFGYFIIFFRSPSLSTSDFVFFFVCHFSYLYKFQLWFIEMAVEKN